MQASIEIINYRDRPLGLTGIDYESNRFTATLDTLYPGKHYRPGTKIFEIDATTDLDSITLTYASGSDGDYFQTGINLDPGKVTAGPVQSSIIINSNYQDFPVI